ncbi:MAG: LD-carboxypeptidase [Rhodocyclaceae bacterium]|nr:MAG: LD-carboxypeptidase [Rhodocyclaceae bacterium]
MSARPEKPPGVSGLQPVAPGSTIGVIAPAGPASAESIDAIAPWLEARGYKSHVFPGCRKNCAYLAGDDQERLADMHAAFSDPGVDAIICMRGGYGSARLLDGIDYALIRRHAKPFVGYSDITALHLAFAQHAGISSIHGPMLTSDLLGAKDRASADALFRMLSEGLASGADLPCGDARLSSLLGGTARGRLVGGNLSVVCSLLGTPWAIETRDKLLFVEDRSEDSYRVDRLLTQLRLAGKLDEAAGFLVGSFSDADDSSAVIRELLVPFGKPILAGWPAGHCAPNYPLPHNMELILDAGAQRLIVA